VSYSINPQQESIMDGTQSHIGEDLVFRMEVIETVLGEVVGRLLGDPWVPPTGGSTTHWGGRPVWWWRAKLVEWCGSTSTRARYCRDELRGLRMMLKDLDDDSLQIFLDGLPQPRSTALSA